MFLQWQDECLQFFVFSTTLGLLFSVRGRFDWFAPYSMFMVFWYFGSFEILLHGEMPGERGR